jgi:hypothetical protein
MMVDLVLGIVAALSCARSMQTNRQAGSPGQRACRDARSRVPAAQEIALFLPRLRVLAVARGSRIRLRNKRVCVLAVTPPPTPVLCGQEVMDICIEAARDALEALGPAHSEKSYEVGARV